MKRLTLLLLLVLSACATLSHDAIDRHPRYVKAQRQHQKERARRQPW